MNKKIFNKQLYLIITSSFSLLLILINHFYKILNEFSQGFFTSFGVVLLIGFIHLSFSKKQQEYINIQNSDERVKMINEKSNSISSNIQQIVLILLIIGFTFFESTKNLSIILTIILLLNSIIFIITKTILSKKY